MTRALTFVLNRLLTLIFSMDEGWMEGEFMRPGQPARGDVDLVSLASDMPRLGKIGCENIVNVKAIKWKFLK